MTVSHYGYIKLQNVSFWLLPHEACAFTYIYAAIQITNVAAYKRTSASSFATNVGKISVQSVPLLFVISLTVTIEFANSIN